MGRLSVSLPPLANGLPVLLSFNAVDKPEREAKAAERKAAKAAEKAETEAAEAEAAEASKKPMTADEIAFEAMVLCSVNRISDADFIAALKKQITILSEAACSCFTKLSIIGHFQIGDYHMTKRHIQPMGRHKPLRSSWGQHRHGTDNNVVRPVASLSAKPITWMLRISKALRKQQAAGNLAELDRLLESL